MNVNISAYSKFTSKSQADSKVTSRNENFGALGNSLASYDQLKQSVSTRQPSISNGRSGSLYVAKLQSKILELQKKIDSQRYQIDILTAETKHFTQICEKQKYQLSSMNVQTLRGQYEEQIRELVQQKQKITEFIYNLNEEYRLHQMQQEAQLNIIKDSNSTLTLEIEEALREKEMLLSEIAKLDRQHLLSEEILLEQEERIDQLRNIERKLNIALKEKRVIQGKK